MSASRRRISTTEERSSAPSDVVATSLPHDVVLQGDCLEVMRTLPDASVDAIVTDPPAGIAFMGKTWDTDKGGRAEWIAWLAEIMREAYRVLKPGGHALVWALPRTSHWTAMALEDAGFEIRDRVSHLFGSGFPKSLDVSKAIDKAAGAAREVVGRAPDWKVSRKWREAEGRADLPTSLLDITAPATDAARQWQGWGTALKPAVEDWWLCRKPLAEPNVAANVLRYGTGALNVDACRVGYQNEADKALALSGDAFKRKDTSDKKAWARPWMDDPQRVAAVNAASKERAQAGRWPANLLLSHAADCTDGACVDGCPVRELDAQSGGHSKTGRRSERSRSAIVAGTTFGVSNHRSVEYPDDDGTGASRFFYVAKASRAERNAGCDELPNHRSGYRPNDPDENSIRTRLHGSQAKGGNGHPTVKPLALMSWLCRLITPPDGVILDPFAGSGSTCVAALREGFRFIGIEREAEYVAIANTRIAHALREQRQASTARNPGTSKKRTPATKQVNRSVARPSLWEGVGA